METMEAMEAMKTMETESKLPLADAIFLGSHLVRGKGGAEWYSDGSGCARGMALEAIGVKRMPSMGDWLVDGMEFGMCLHQFISVWPWTTKTKTTYPCGCDRWLEIDPVSSIIEHLFDRHVDGVVYTQLTKWTLEKLCDWVRSVDPTPKPSEIIERVHAVPDHSYALVLVSK